MADDLQPQARAIHQKLLSEQQRIAGGPKDYDGVADLTVGSMSALTDLAAVVALLAGEVAEIRTWLADREQTAPHPRELP